MTQQEVVPQYEAKIRDLQTKINQTGGPLGLVLAGAMAFLFLGLSAMRGEVSWVWALAPVPVLVYGARQFLQGQQAQFRQIRLKRFYEAAIERVKGNWAGAPATGAEFADPDHLYTNDLNCFGEGSLFQLLCSARTAIGRQRLADYLSEPPSIEETRLRQDAVRELTERVDLRDAIATLGEHEFLESRGQTFEEWLDLPAFDFPKWVPIVCVATVIILIGLITAGILHKLSWIDVRTYAIPFALLNTGVGMYFRDRVNATGASLRQLSAETVVLQEGLNLLAGQSFQSVKLNGLVSLVKGAGPAIQALKRPLAVLAQRDQDWFYLPTRALVMGTQACMMVERWRGAHGASLLAWVDAWAEFEALVSLGTYCHENPDHTFPEFSDKTSFVAEGLGHPLLAAESCVTNDVELSLRQPFYVVSGSNMSGKSTLLRSIGLNAVLGFAGAPVRARSMRFSGLSIVASLSVGDSLMHGRSKFMAEVERLKAAIESAVAGRPVLFLVDEIFSGTNSRDRRVAAEAVVRTLVQRGAIGALSTHDLALAEIAGTAAGLGGINVHMGSRDGSDPMDFDYRLKMGVTTEANALAIARMAGVPV